MNTKHIITALCGLSVALHAQTPPLTPSGPPTDPATAMKSLNQVEARTIIDALPFTISQPGSYYLTSNLEFTAASGDAITVNADNVTIDLNGFTLSSTAAVTGSCIALGANRSQLSVTNGFITGTTVVLEANWNTTPGGFSNGVHYTFSSSSRAGRFSRLSISGCRDFGLRAPPSSILDDIRVSQCGSRGIEAEVSTIRSCIVTGNAADGLYANSSSVEGCIAIRNQFHGVFAGTVTDTAASSNGDIGIEAVNVSNSNASGNSGIGIQGQTISGCVASGNDGDGLVGSGFAACSISFSSAWNNQGKGIVVVNNGVISFCSSSGNTGTQIDATNTTRTGNNPTP
jgi:hypothetical protein